MKMFLQGEGTSVYSFEMGLGYEKKTITAIM